MLFSRFLPFHKHTAQVRDSESYQITFHLINFNWNSDYSLIKAVDLITEVMFQWSIDFLLVNDKPDKL